MSGTGVQFAAETLDLAVKGATAYEREDLVQRLTGARHLLSDNAVTVYVVGEFKQGKSSLINGLLTAPVCPVDDDIATAVPTKVGYSQQVRAVASFESAAGNEASPWQEEVPVAEIASYVTERGNPGNHRRLRSVTVGIDRPLLASGLTLVDTPGVGGLGSVHNAVTVGSLPQAHAVVFVSDASQELTAAEIRFLRTVKELCPTIVFVLTKTDLYPEWKRIRDIDVEHLARAGLSVDVLEVSSELRNTAAAAGDQELNVESGFPPLVQRLQDIVRDAERVALRSVGSHVLSVVGQLEPALQSRAASLTTPQRSAALVADLTRARERAEALRERSSHWQQVLFDGFADISSDIDFDLRQRSREVLHDAEKAIDEGDPAKDWPGFEQWMRQRLAGEALENYGQFARRARELAERVAEQFDLAADQAVAPVGIAAPVEVIEEIDIDSSFSIAPKKFAGGMAGFQKAYGGFMMFTLLTHMAAIALPGPVGLGLGLLMGKSGLGEERKRQLEKRRAGAKAAVRRFVDEFNLQVGKDSRDALRRIQREMRDAYTRRAEELQRSTKDALAAAQKAVTSSEAETDELARLQSDLESFAMVRDRAREVLAHASRPAVTSAGSR
ncbi:dynamin family protein [Actinomycetospora endophytica]|uniref:Dynamin family protein n=1 Tax=Actinomycetospora endophytica TaxID=2291215 RepID=A0ABS8PB95_9PSEU|nr:dynamin family protein [Actinomycetospora endophytica]MCD2195527.1 dynamin family protein [Actinomycetospora endophytica]